MLQLNRINVEALGSNGEILAFVFMTGTIGNIANARMQPIIIKNIAIFNLLFANGC